MTRSSPSDLAARLERVRLAVLAGLTSEAIAKREGCSIQTIWRDRTKLRREGQLIAPLPVLRQFVGRAAEEAGVPQAVILGPTRIGYVVRARHRAMVAAWLKGFSLPQIGRAFNRDHTTVLHAIRKLHPEVVSPVFYLSPAELRRKPRLRAV